jgi:uncharacterized protein (TIGR04255 family)
MEFQPINDDHAIQSASVVVSLDKNLPPSFVDTLVKLPAAWRADLPAMEFSQLLDVGINPQTGAPASRMVRGVEFSHKRPDGSASWLLSALAKDLRIETALYTRWDAIWAKARTILANVVSQLAAHERANEINVASLGHTVVDVFYTTNSNPDFRELFCANDMIPPGLYSRGALWHCHTGWFENRNGGRILNQLNIGITQGPDPSVQGSERLIVTIQHNQVYQLTEHLPLSGLDNAMSEVPIMHEANKNLLRTILANGIQERIKINS